MDFKLESAQERKKGAQPRIWKLPSSVASLFSAHFNCLALLVKSFNNMCGSEGVRTLPNKNGFATFLLATAVGSKECTWAVAASARALIATLWIDSVPM